MEWSRWIKHRGCIFTKDNTFHHGVSPQGLDCYLRESTFPNMIGASGYVVVPSALLKLRGKNLLTAGNELMTTDNEETTVSVPLTITDLFKNADTRTVHGGISYNRSNLLGTDVGDAVVLGFDTSHAESPRYATLEFMIDEVLKLSKWACGRAVGVSEDFVKFKTVKNADEDYFSWVLRTVEEEGRKLPLPNEEMFEFENPADYLTEVLRRIEHGVPMVEELTEEEKAMKDKIEKEEMQKMGNMIMAMMANRRANKQSKESDNDSGSDSPAASAAPQATPSTTTIKRIIQVDDEGYTTVLGKDQRRGRKL